MDDRRQRSDPNPLDPVFTRSLREAWLILGVWALCLCWCVGYCRLNGYNVQGPVDVVWGMPSWVCWGIFVPWLLATAASIAIGLFIVRDQPLEDVAHANDVNEGGVQ